MANRYFTAVLQSMEKLPVLLFAKVTFGSSGAATLSAINSKGILSITQDATGKYTFVFGTNSKSLDTYYKLLDASVIFDTSGPAAAPAAPSMYITSNAIATAGSASLQVQLDDLAGVAANPASGEIGYFKFIFGNSSAY